MKDDVKCEHKRKCTSYPSLCGTCLNNQGKRDYYEPIAPSTLVYPYQPWATLTADSNNFQYIPATHT